MDDCTKSPLSSAWSELPQEIISNIERCLDSAVDMSSLRSVCKNWHSSLKPDNVSILSPFLPMIFSNVRLPFADRKNEPIVLIARAVFLVKPLDCSSDSCGWLLTVEEMVPDEEKNEWINVRDTTYCSKVLFISSHWSFFIYTRELDLRYHLPEQKDPKAFDVNLKNSINEDYVIYSKNYVDSLSVHYASRLYNGEASIDLGISVFFSDSENMSFWKQYFHSITIDLLWPPPAWFWTDPHLTSREDEELDGHRQNGAVFQIQIMAVENSDAATIQNLNRRNSSTTEFKGVNINSNLVSTLQKIWEKYGDLMEQITFRNADIIARALESLATAVIILQSNTGNSLNKDHADYLNSALCDLQQMKFRVDWLVPFVEKAIAAQKSRPMIDAMKEFNKVSAVAAEMKQKFIDEKAKFDELYGHMGPDYWRRPELLSMDFDRSLGDGLC